MAVLGAASIKGVPALGFPKISGLVGRIAEQACKEANQHGREARNSKWRSV
jgi:hypothetical protein